MHVLSLGLKSKHTNIKKTSSKHSSSGAGPLIYEGLSNGNLAVITMVAVCLQMLRENILRKALGKGTAKEN